MVEKGRVVTSPIWLDMFIDPDKLCVAHGISFIVSSEAEMLRYFKFTSGIGGRL